MISLNYRSFFGPQRSLGLLAFGLFFAIFAFYSPPIGERFLSPVSNLLRPLLWILRPFNSLGQARVGISPTDQDLSLPSLAGKEAAYITPSNPTLASRRVLFANLLRRGAEEHDLVLDAGSEEGVRLGMAGVVKNHFVGVVVQVKAHQSFLRLPTHPNSRVGARAGKIRLVASGSGREKVKVELPQQRNLVVGASVFVNPGRISPREATWNSGLGKAPIAWELGLEAARGSRLGTLEGNEGSARKSFWIRLAVDPRSVQSVWLLAAQKNPGAPTIRPIRFPKTTPVRVHWGDVSPRSDSFLFGIEEGKGIALGNALVEGGKLIGKVGRLSGSLGWARLLGDSNFQVERLLLRDDGVVLPLGKGGFERAGENRLGLRKNVPGLREGWLFTGAGEPGVPKGILIGRVRRDAERFLVETPGFSPLERVQVVQGSFNP